MTRTRRVFNVITSLITIAAGILIIIYPETALPVVLAVIAIVFLFRGVGAILYYITMAKYMVGGRTMLFVGIFFLDFSLLTSTVRPDNLIYIVLYLLGIHLFSGAVSVLQGIENRRLKAPEWKFNFSIGICNILLALAILFTGFIHKSVEMVMYIYAAGLIYSACLRIRNSFRKTAIVFIQ